MKYFLIAAVALAMACTSVLAEPIRHDEDSRTVTLEIACWVWIHFDDTQGRDFYLDVEAGQGGAWATLPFTYGQNCPGVVSGALTPPPGAPGMWDWWFMNQDKFIPCPDPGVYQNAVTVGVSGITIMDPAGSYPGGVMTIAIDCLPHPPA